MKYEIIIPIIHKVFYPAYPNPCHDRINLEVGSSAPVFKLAIVNTSLDILDSVYEPEFSGNSLYLFDISDRSTFQVNTIYRMYYMFEYENGFVERGHGDFRVMDDL